MKKVFVVCGPTATGKTALAAHVAHIFDGELISADSRQVYKGMDLTTGKDRVDVPVWLYDVVMPDEDFSVSHWVRLARRAVSDIWNRGKLPIVVGGTGLYIRALLDPFETINIPPNKAIRKKFQNAKVEELQTMIPRGNMNDSDWNNPRRLIRKIEIHMTNKIHHIVKSEYDTLQCGIKAPLSVLDTRIDERLHARKKAGLDKEIAVLNKKYDKNLPAMSAINLNEHAYARRQLTWFNKQKEIHWFTIPYDVTQVEKLVTAWYTNI